MRGSRPRNGPVLPLGKDASSRYGTLIVGAMVYIASIALAGAMMLSSVGQAWRDDLAGALTVQVMPQGADTEAVVARVLGLLRASPDIAAAEPLDESAMRALLSPWLGDDVDLSSLPTPALIDVRIVPGRRIDAGALAARLAAEVPGATVDDHGLWLADLSAFADALEAVGYLIVTLAGATAIVTVVFATRAGLAMHEDVIEILHLIGARDGYIARQFQTHVRALALGGGVIGFVLAAATILALGRFAPVVESVILPEMVLSPLQWLTLTGLPFIAAAVCMATARVTVMRALPRAL